MKTFLSKKEIYILLSLLAVCIFAILCLRFFSEDSIRAAVYYNGTRIKELSLNNDSTVHIDADLPVTLEIKNGAVRFVNSECPDKICEHFGWISGEYEYAVCAPAGVTVIIED